MKNLISLLLTILSINSLYTSHLLGGNFEITQNSANNYSITLTCYRDCNSPIASPFDQSLAVKIGIFDKMTNSLILEFNPDTLLLDTVSNSFSNCYDSQGACIEIGMYVKDSIDLPNNTNGYYVVWERCCRQNVYNFYESYNHGTVFYAEIPDPLLVNSTPIFTEKFSNSNFLACVNQLNYLDFSVNDFDGDSISYSIVTPWIGSTNYSSVLIHTTPVSGPYAEAIWDSGYSLINPLGINNICMINQNTGILTLSTTNIGKVALAILVEEFRSGVKIGEVRKEMQINVLACNSVLNAQINSMDNLAWTTYDSSYNFKWIDCIEDSVLNAYTDSSFEAPYSGYFSVIIFDSTCTSDTSSCVYLDLTTSNNEASPNEQFKFYPNPVHDIINITNEQDEIIISDLNGKIILKSNKNTINVSALESGTYLIQMKKDLSVKRYKFMKK